MKIYLSNAMFYNRAPFEKLELYLEENEIAVLTAGRFEYRDEGSIKAGPGKGAKAASDLAIDDTVTQGLFGSVVGGRDIRTL